jgi:parvulin-like peptidyl-prolyl isomerase
MKLNKSIAFAALFLIAASFAGAKVMDSTVATVNGKAILSSDYEKLKQSVLEQYKKNAPQLLQKQDNVTALGEEVLNQMITDELLIQAAKEQGIKVKDTEVAQGINEVKTRFSVDAEGKKITDNKQIEKAFNDELKKEGLTYKQFEDRIKDQLAVRKAVDAAVKAKAKQPSKEDVKQLFDDVQLIMKGNTKDYEKLPKERLETAIPLAAKLNQLTAEQIKISPIFIKADKGLSAAALKDKENQAKDIKKQIKDNKITFLKAIEQYSDDKSALASGGEVILVRGVMPKDFDEKVFSTPVGEISDPVKTDFGFYVIRVNEKKARQEVALSQIEGELGQYLSAVEMQKAMGDYLQSIKEKADIKVLIKFDYQTPAPAAKADAAQKPAPAPAAKK